MLSIVTQSSLRIHTRGGGEELARAPNDIHVHIPIHPPPALPSHYFQN